MSKYTWRELERADMDAAAAHAFDMEYRAEQIARELQKHLARMEHIVDGLGEVKGEIVRCRDCKHGHEVTWPVQLQIPPDYINCSGYLVETWDYYNDEPKDNPVPPDGFCAWGERHSWRELENSDQYIAAAHAFDTVNHNTCCERGE